MTAAVCDLGTWRRIVKRAVSDALQGDDKARGWLSDVLLGRDRPKLSRVIRELRVGDDEGDNGEDDEMPVDRDLWDSAMKDFDAVAIPPGLFAQVLAGKSLSEAATGLSEDDLANPPPKERVELMAQGGHPGAAALLAAWAEGAAQEAAELAEANGGSDEPK